MIENSQLQTLVTVAKYCSFSRAAEELGVTQSAISQSIKNLEKKVNSVLFKRSGKQVVLTEEGNKLFYLASDYLTKFEDVLEEISNQKNSMKGKVRIGTLYGVGKSWLTPLMIEFGKEYPMTSTRITLGFPDEIVDMFEKNLLDAIVVPEFALPHSGEKTLLGEEKSVLIYNKDNEYGIHENIDLETLSNTPTILYEHNDDLYMKWCREKFGSHPKKVFRKLVVNSHGYIIRAVVEGLGVAVIPTHVLYRSSHRKKVQVLGGDQIENSKMYLVTQSENSDSLKLLNLKEKLISAKYNLDNELSSSDSQEL